jgi:hypothetical protein
MLAAVLLLAACTSDPGTERDAAATLPEHDGSMPSDAAVSLDAAVPLDGSVARDAGPLVDAGDASTLPPMDGSVMHNDASVESDAGSDASVPTGRWTTGDLHVHTIESNDAQVTLSAVLEAAFATNQLDWITLSNHLRVSDRDHEGSAVVGGPIPMSKAVALFEQPYVEMLQQAGTYADNTVFSAVEWDVPTHDHINVGMLAVDGTPDARALNEFEYLFTTRDPAMFEAADVTAWGAQRYNATHDDALHAIGWLKERLPDTSYAAINHAFRKPSVYTIANFREFNDLAPSVVFLYEGMVGNQMEPDRGGYNSAYIEDNAHARTYGGVDAAVAKVGGIWDALLGEGRRIWNVADSDFHFKTASGQFSSGYFPGEYAKTHVWVDGEGMPAVLAGLRSGKSFAAYGNLISALDFSISAEGAGFEEMGGELSVTKGSTIRVSIRFRSDVPSNYEAGVGSGNHPGAIPVLDHLDLIAGDVGAKAAPNTAAYDVATNTSTHVAARFTDAEWTVDADGSKVMTYELTADKDQYFRLRGTNLGTSVPGETENGEPLADAKVDIVDNQARFDAINERNYADLWFYSNPIFVRVH